MAEYGESLSDRELDVLRELAAGASNKSIADDLSISPYTVKTHLRNIFTKLGVSTRTEAITVAMQQGLLAMPVATPEAMSDVLSVNLPAMSETGAIVRISDDGEPSPPPVVAQPTRTRSSRLRMTGALAGVLVVALAVAAWLIMRQLDGASATSATTPFEEQPIGETRWLTGRPLPQPRAGAAGAVGLDVYLLSGRAQDGVTGEVLIYNTQTRDWRQAAEKPTPVSETRAAELFGELYVPGGIRADGTPTDIVEAYSPSQNAWRRVAPLPRPIAGGLTIADGGFLYVLGGWDGNEYLDTAYVYDPAGDSWRPLSSLPAPRAYAAGDALMGRLYVTGGSDGESSQATCYVYAPSLDEWSDCPELLEPRVGAGATVLLNKLYIIGGAGDNGEHGEVYDPNTRTWTVLNMPPGTAARTDAGVTRVENRIYALGGRDGATLTDDALIYSPYIFQTYIPAAPSGPDQ